MFTFSAVYYSDGRVPAPLRKFCLETLAKGVADSGGELMCVTWEPLDSEIPGGRNLIWPEHAGSHANMYEQILAGIDAARSETILLAEHDVLYPAGYHEAMLRASRANLCYNTNVVCLNAHGFFPVGTKYLLSNFGGPRSAIARSLREKLGEIGRQGYVAWAEPPGEIEISTQYPAVDVRHGLNFTGMREAAPGGYTASHPWWGEASAYTRLFT